MPVYEFTAPYHEIGFEERFLGFANNATKQYLSLQRWDCTKNEILPGAANVWIERDDQAWGGHGGIESVILERECLIVHLASELAAHMGGYEEYRVRLVLSDEDFAKVREQLLRVMVGYGPIVRMPA